MYCVSCHTDHNYFNRRRARRANNLRQGIGLAGSLSDEHRLRCRRSPYGICISCHTTSLTKDQTYQKAPTNVATVTPPISGAQLPGVEAQLLSAQHDHRWLHLPGQLLEVPQRRAGVRVLGEPRRRQRLRHCTSRPSPGCALALGAAITASPSQSNEENLCFGCHSGGAAGKDGYNVAAMSLKARSIRTDVEKANAHSVEAYSGVHRSDEYNAALASRDRRHHEPAGGARATR